MRLHEAIGKPAMLEQTAEECIECAFACLKLARFYRGENKVYNRDETTMIQDINEELVDIQICQDGLLDSGLVKKDLMDYFLRVKLERQRQRMQEDAMYPEKSESDIKMFKQIMSVMSDSNFPSKQTPESCKPMKPMSPFKK